MSELGPLAASLAKAQVAFPTVTRDKKVTVTTKTGGSYSFTYAPLDSILNAVRVPLADNGLVVVQLIDDGDLVTSLIHESGGILSGRVALPTDVDIQGFGSAITYLRRYALQALLGIAAEDDDDGNRSLGNTAAIQPRKAPTPSHADGLLGTAEVGKGDADFELRKTPDGFHLAFRLVQGRKGFKVIAWDALAESLALIRADVEGQPVTVWGTFHDETFRPKGKDQDVTYQVIHLERIATADLILPAPSDVAPGQEELPL
jgi:hypothetical protein